MKEIRCATMGEAWQAACQHILDHGTAMQDGSVAMKEVMHLFMTVTHPAPDDTFIQQYGDPAMTEWMLSNFRDQKCVPELKNAPSYGTRLYNYHGKDQLAWVVRKLQQKPETKAATIPLILPEDEGYIPCVSMLDFKIRNRTLQLTAVCRSIDFGKKAYANLLALHDVQQHVANALQIPTGELVMDIISAHIDKEHDLPWM